MQVPGKIPDAVLNELKRVIPAMGAKKTYAK